MLELEGKGDGQGRAGQSQIPTLASRFSARLGRRDSVEPSPSSALGARGEARPSYHNRSLQPSPVSSSILLGAPPDDKNSPRPSLASSRSLTAGSSLRDAAAMPIETLYISRYVLDSQASQGPLASTFETNPAHSAASQARLSSELADA